MTVNKPLRLLYTTPFGHYFYETNRNEILRISPALYNYLYALQHNLTSSSVDKPTLDEYEGLVNAGYLSGSRISLVRHSMTDQVEELLSRKIDKLTLQVTQNCNLRCSYCIYSYDSNHDQRSHSQKSMTLQTAKKAVDFYYDHSVDSSNAAISFYGGEPLLQFPLIKEIVAYAEALFSGKNIVFSITTNATLLTEEIARFLCEHNFHILLSIDGPKAIHDKNRKTVDGHGSFEKVIQGLKIIRNTYPESMLSDIMVSMVISPQESYRSYKELFQSELLQGLNLTYSFVEEDSEFLYPSVKDYFDDYYYDLFFEYFYWFRNETGFHVNTITETDISHSKYTLDKFKTSILGTVGAPNGPCIPGKMRLFVNCLEELYPCERVNEDKCMKIGSLDNGFDIDNIKRILNISSLTPDKCVNCWAFSKCNICAKRAEERGTFSVEKRNRACSLSQSAAFQSIMEKTIMFESVRHLQKISAAMEAKT